jgi:hypothetical protein
MLDEHPPTCARALGRMRTSPERRPAAALHTLRLLPRLTTSASTTTSTSFSSTTSCSTCSARRAFFAGELAPLSLAPLSLAPLGLGSLGRRAPMQLHCRLAPLQAAVAIRGPFGPFDSILFYRKMAIRFVGVTVRGAQELIALSRYHHIATIGGGYK